MKKSFTPLDIAGSMKVAQDQVRQIETFTSQSNDFDIISAYEVSRLIHEARSNEGALPVGRKIGFTNPAMWDRYGVRAPIWGYMYDRTVVMLDDADTLCGLSAFCEPMIEPEIVLHFRSAPPVGADRHEVLASIDWIAHGFEIVQSHFPGWRFQAADTVADGGLHGTLLVGTPVPLERLGNDPLAVLTDFTLELFRNDELQETGRGANVLGNPILAVEHLIDVLAGQTLAPGLQAGEMVTTGTLTEAYPVNAGETWHSQLTGAPLPGLRVTFTDQ